MKYKKHLQMFLRDHLWIIGLFVSAPIGFMIFSFFLNDSKQTDIVYYIFLSLFVLGCFLSYRFYATWNIYEIFCTKPKSMNDCILRETKSLEEKHYSQLMKEVRKIYIKDIQALQDKQKSNKLMIYQWVHQLKTPLSVISLIAENHSGDEEYNKVLQSVKQIHYDLNQVLNMYQLESIENNFHSEKVNLHHMVKDCINELKSMFIENQIYPKLHIEENMYVYTDYKWIKFVLYQLLTNAVKYSDAGKCVFIFAKENKESITISIQDEGCGIEKSDINRIFNLFFTGQNGRMRKESSGLGLYMVKKILNYLGHTIKVESELSKGSIFTIYFLKASYRENK